MTFDRIIAIIFASILIGIGSYFQLSGAAVFPSLCIFLSVVLVIFGIIGPQSIKTLTLKKGEFKIQRHIPSEKEISEAINLSIENKIKDFSQEPLVAAATKRKTEEKSASDYLLLATKAWKEKKYDKGLQYAYQGLSLNPDNIRVKSALELRIGTLFKKLGNKNLAIKQYKKAMKTDPIFSWPPTNLGLIYFEHGDLEKAEKLYRKAIELDPKNSSAHGNLGVPLAQQG